MTQRRSSQQQHRGRQIGVPYHRHNHHYQGGRRRPPTTTPDHNNNDNYIDSSLSSYSPPWELTPRPHEQPTAWPADDDDHNYDGLTEAFSRAAIQSTATDASTWQEEAHWMSFRNAVHCFAARAAIPEYRPSSSRRRNAPPNGNHHFHHHPHHNNVSLGEDTSNASSVSSLLSLPEQHSPPPIRHIDPAIATNARVRQRFPPSFVSPNHNDEDGANLNNSSNLNSNTPISPLTGRDHEEDNRHYLREAGSTVPNSITDHIHGRSNANTNLNTNTKINNHHKPSHPAAAAAATGDIYPHTSSRHSSRNSSQNNNHSNNHVSHPSPSSSSSSHELSESHRKQLSKMASDLAETKMRLALAQAERDELEFALLMTEESKSSSKRSSWYRNGRNETTMTTTRS